MGSKASVRNGGFVCGLTVARIAHASWSTRIVLPKRGVRTCDLKAGGLRAAENKDKGNVFVGEVVLLRAGCYRATRLPTLSRPSMKSPESKVFELVADPDLVVQPLSEMDVFREALFWSCGASTTLDSDYLVDYAKLCDRQYFNRYNSQEQAR